MSESLSAIPSGIRYYFGDEARLRRSVEQTAMSVFNGWSYEEITTPALDYYSLFERGMGSLEAQRAFRFTDTDGRMLALRPDVTSGIARAVATVMENRPRPLRFCYAAPVFRAQRESHAEWRRASTQIGCELIGRNSTMADMEVLAIVCEILSCLELSDGFTITLNDMEIFNGIAQNLGLEGDARDEMRQLVDTHNATDLERFLSVYSSEGPRRAFTQLVQLSGKSEVFDRASQVITNERSRHALDRLESLWRTVDALALSDRFEIDLADVSRLDYYTGLVFKIYVKGAGVSVGSGGRYDKLTANFGKAEPAVGFVLDLDVLVDVISTRSTGPVLTKETKKEALPLSGENPEAIFAAALRKRAQGERVVIGSKEVTSCRT